MKESCNRGGVIKRGQLRPTTQVKNALAEFMRFQNGGDSERQDADQRANASYKVKELCDLG